MAAVSAPVESSPALAAEAPSATTVTRTVVEGDTLWHIAEQYYGDGIRYADIYRASTATVQPDGAQLSDPNLIRPGWVMTIPDIPTPTESATAPRDITTPHPGGSAADSTPAPTVGSDGRRGTPVPTQSAAPLSSSRDVPREPQLAREGPTRKESVDEGIDMSVPLMTGGGIVELLAAGLLVVLGRRRLQQRRNRSVRERVAMPEPASGDLESQLRMITDPINLHRIDTALRTLQCWAAQTGGALPDLFARRVAGDELALYLGEPARLPAPFVVAHYDQTMWTIPCTDLVPPTEDVVAPYPALMTIGVDQNGGVLLLNLEHFGLLNIVGDDTACRGFLSAVAAELASSPWAEQIQVTLLGMPDELGRSLDPSRVHRSTDVQVVLRNLRHDLDDRSAAFGSLRIHDTRQARAAATGTESWAAHVALIGDPREPNAEPPWKRWSPATPVWAW